MISIIEFPSPAFDELLAHLTKTISEELKKEYEQSKNDSWISIEKLKVDLEINSTVTLLRFLARNNIPVVKMGHKTVVIPKNDFLVKMNELKKVPTDGRSK